MISNIFLFIFIFLQVLTQFSFNPFSNLSTSNGYVSKDTSNDESEVHSISHPLNPYFFACIYHHFNAGSVRVELSLTQDSGYTWKHSIVDVGYDPTCFILKNGYIGCSFIGYPFSKPKFALSSNNGDTWNILDISLELGADKIWSVADTNSNSQYQNSIYAGWVVFSYSSSKLYFSIIRPPYNNPIVKQLNIPIEYIYTQGVNFVIDKNGYILLSYYEIDTRNYDYVVSYKYIISTDGGNTFSTPFQYGTTIWSRVLMPRGIDIGTLPSISVFNDTVYIVSNEREDYWKIVKYSFYYLNPNVVKRQVLTTNGDGWYCFPSIVNGNIIQYTKIIETENRYYIGQYLIINDSLHEVIPIYQIGIDSSKFYYRHHYNQVTVSNNKTSIFSFFTDYINFTNDIAFSSKNLYIYSTEKYSNDFVIFPNPSNGIFTVSGLNEFMNLCLFDISGKLLFDTNILNKKIINLNLTSLSSGVYIIRHNNKSKKMMIIK